MYTTEFVDIPLSELLVRVQTLKHEGMRFIQMCAETTEAGIDLLYTFYDETREHALNLCVYGIDDKSEVPSIEGLYFAAFSYENETHDLYGVRFANMKLDFGGNFFNVADESPMTVITPEMKAERDKLARQKAAQAAKARKAAEEAQAKEGRRGRRSQVRRRGGGKARRSRRGQGRSRRWLRLRRRGRPRRRDGRQARRHGPREGREGPCGARGAEGQVGSQGR